MYMEAQMLRVAKVILKKKSTAAGLGFKLYCKAAIIENIVLG